jgi:hypothetical protein
MFSMTCGLMMAFFLLAPAPDEKPTEDKTGLKSRVERIVAQLDSDDFSERERATEELIQLGKPALEILRRLLETTNVLEVRRRLEKVIAAIDPPPPVKPAERLSPDGKVLARSTVEGTVILLDASAKKELRRMQGQVGPITLLEFSKNGNYLLSFGFGFLRVFDVATGAVLADFSDRGDPIMSAKFVDNTLVEMTTGTGKTAHLSFDTRRRR